MINVRKSTAKNRILWVFVVLIGFLGFFYFFGQKVFGFNKTLIIALDEYNDTNLTDLRSILRSRVEKQPFNLVAMLLFLGAIFHTFSTHFFRRLSRELKQRNIGSKCVSLSSRFCIQVLDLLGKVEIIFGLWLIPLFLLFVFSYDWKTAIDYLKGVSYVEALFVVVAMCITSSGPILSCVEKLFGYLTKFSKNTVSAWWWVILTLGPLLGSFITEPGAMTVSAFLLTQKFYRHDPGRLLAYGTFGLLFANISVAGVLTHFISSPMSIADEFRRWDTHHLFWHFGWKAFLVVMCSNAIYYFIFRKKFSEIEAQRLKNPAMLTEDRVAEAPYWITVTHLLFLLLIVMCNNYSLILIGLFFLFLSFYRTTIFYQRKIELKHCALVGFFLASLVIHGNLQGWWVQPVLKTIVDNLLFFESAISGVLNHAETAVFLGVFVPDFHELMKFAVVVSAVTESELSVISNARNSSGESIAAKYFQDGSSSFFLILSVFIPAIMIIFMFYFISVIFE